MKLKDIPYKYIERLRGMLDKRTIKTSNSDDCWLYGKRLSRYGYGRLSISYGGEQSDIPASRIAYFLAHPEDHPSGLVVMHSCDNPPCVNPNHLRLGTLLENSQDSSIKGRMSGKIRPNHKPKLTLEQKQKIGRIYSEGKISQRDLAKQFNTSQREVSITIQELRDSRRSIEQCKNRLMFTAVLALRRKNAISTC